MFFINGETRYFDGILFLDCDGVINSEKWFKSPECRAIREKYRELNKNLIIRSDDRDVSPEQIESFRETHTDPKCVEVLNKILIKFNLAIVLSSTWRVADFTLKAFLSNKIDKINERFLGCTPKLKYSGKDSGRDSRGLEIIDWMQKFNFNGKYFILDDDADFDVKYNKTNLLTRHVQPHFWEAGLEEKHILKFDKLNEN